MNLNPLATAGLVMIGLSQVSQAWTALQPTPQETHFRVVQEFCKTQGEGAGTADKSMRSYIKCMAQHAVFKDYYQRLDKMITDANIH